jgi:hypothetical protein
MLPSKLLEDNVAKASSSVADFVGHRAALPEAVRPVTTFAFWTGCRKGETLTLIWPQVDLLENVVRLKKTKNGEPGLFLLLASC